MAGKGEVGFLSCCWRPTASLVMELRPFTLTSGKTTIYFLRVCGPQIRLSGRGGHRGAGPSSRDGKRG